MHGHFREVLCLCPTLIELQRKPKNWGRRRNNCLLLIKSTYGGLNSFQKIRQEMKLQSCNFQRIVLITQLPSMLLSSHEKIQIIENSLEWNPAIIALSHYNTTLESTLQQSSSIASSKICNKPKKNTNQAFFYVSIHSFPQLSLLSSLFISLVNWESYPGVFWFCFCARVDVSQGEGCGVIFSVKEHA